MRTGEGMRDKRCSQDDSEKVVMWLCVLFLNVTSLPLCPQGLCLYACEEMNGVGPQPQEVFG